MKKLKLLRVFKYISGGITLILGLSYIFGKYILSALTGISSGNSEAIGVIGGADGPTTIFLATKTGGLSLEIFTLFFAVITTMLFILEKRVKNK